MVAACAARTVSASAGLALFFTHQSNDLFITGVDASHGRAWRREPVPTDMSKMMGSRHRAIKKDWEMGKRKEGGEVGGRAGRRAGGRVFVASCLGPTVSRDSAFFPSTQA